MTRRRLLFAYQLLTGLSDTTTGLLLLVAPALTLRLMRVHVPQDALTLLSYVGVFVLSVGIACLYGAALVHRTDAVPKLETVWLLTTITRALVAVFVLIQILQGTLEPGWITVAISDGLLAAIQAVGLRRGWLRDATA